MGRTPGVALENRVRVPDGSKKNKMQAEFFEDRATLKTETLKAEYGYENLDGIIEWVFRANSIDGQVYYMVKLEAMRPDVGLMAGLAKMAEHFAGRAKEFLAREAEASDRLEGMQNKVDNMMSRIRFLDALEQAGVDNWDGYNFANELMEEE